MKLLQIRRRSASDLIRLPEIGSRIPRVSNAARADRRAVFFSSSSVPAHINVLLYRSVHLADDDDFLAGDFDVPLSVAAAAAAGRATAERILHVACT